MSNQILETRNRITTLKEWIEELKKDATVLISSNDDPEKSIIELHGQNVLPLVEKQLEAHKEHLCKLEKEFNSL